MMTMMYLYHDHDLLLLCSFFCFVMRKEVNFVVLRPVDLGESLLVNDRLVPSLQMNQIGGRLEAAAYQIEVEQRQKVHCNLGVG